jgi:superfamily II DNA or RNA helicase
VHAIIRDNQFIYLNNLTQVEEDLVVDRFSLELQDYNRFVDPAQRGGWNGIYRRYDSRRQRLARPFLAALRTLCQQQSVPLVVSDERQSWPYVVTPPDDIGPDWLAGITLTDYQIRAIRIGCRVEVGIFAMPTGAGKTEVMAGLCKAIPCPTMIFADQLVIIDQIKERLELRKVIEEAGLFYAGKTPRGQVIVIGSIQSLTTPSKLPAPPDQADYKDEPSYVKALGKFESTMKGLRSRRRRAKLFQELVQRAQMVMVDECDLATSDSHKSLFRYWCKARRRYGYSGTPFDQGKPVQNLFLQEHLGSVICKVERNEVEAAGRIVPVDYYMVAFGEDGDRDEASAFDIAFRERVTENPIFHRAVAAICRAYPDDGTFILVERDALGLALEQAISGAVFIHGKTPHRRRDEVLQRFERRELKVVIGGKIVKRGLDLSGGCENLVIATGGKLASNITQQVGRAVRLNQRGRSRVFDFYFLNNRYLYNHSRSRLRTMVNQGYRTRVIFRDGQTVDGAAFIASRFRRPKRR